LAGISLDNVSFRYEQDEVLAGVCVELAAGELVAVAGPNGAGKSTLLGVCAGLRSPSSGRRRYKGREFREWDRREFAREVAVVPQQLEVEFPFTAEQVVLMGRAPYGDGMFETEADVEAARRAMELTDCVEYGDRDYRTLSGGERQRVVLAAALAQEPRTLLLDEPTAFLDLKHQVAIYDLLASLRREGLLVVTVTHDLNLAARYADRVLILDRGRVRFSGASKEVLTAENIRSVFGVDCRILEDAEGRSWIAYGA
jgi:iron complex transport system ATP-binding protein